jgi:hypothetical protein
MYARWIKTTVHSTQAVCCLFGVPRSAHCSVPTRERESLKRQTWSQQSRATAPTIARYLDVVCYFCQMRQWSLLQDNPTLYESILPYDMDVWS